MLPGSPEAAGVAVQDQVTAEFLAELAGANPHMAEMDLPAALTEDGAA